MCGGVFLGYDGIIKQFNIFTILLSISLSPVIGMTGLPMILSAWCFDGLLGNIGVREHFLFCCNLVELVC
jgi:hypothetical protein